MEAEDTVIDLEAEDMEEEEDDLHLFKAMNGDTANSQLINQPNGIISDKI